MQCCRIDVNDDSQGMSQVTFKAMGSAEAELLRNPKALKKISVITIHKTMHCATL